MERLLNARELRTDRPDAVQVALRRCRAGADFADAAIAELGRLAGCVRTLTFDRRAAQQAGLQLLE